MDAFVLTIIVIVCTIIAIDIACRIIGYVYSKYTYRRNRKYLAQMGIYI